MISVLYKVDPSRSIGNRLSQAVNRLRKLLEDIPELAIENVPNQGYRIRIGKIAVLSTSKPLEVFEPNKAVSPQGTPKVPNDVSPTTV